MSPFISIGIYLIMVALAFFWTDLCLRKWARTADKAKRLRPFWMIPGALLSLLPIGGAMLPDSAFKFALQAAGNVWLGFFLYYIGLIALLLLICKLVKVISRGRLFSKAYGGVLLVTIVATLAIFGYGLVHAQQPQVVRYDIALDKPAGEHRDMKIVLLGDLHLSVNSRLSTTEKMVELINAEEADAVVIAGDIFTSTYQGLKQPEAYAEALRGIKTTYGVYAVYGNHDVEETLFGGFAISPVSQAFRSAEMEMFFDECGFITLADEVVTLDNAVQIAGRIDGDKAGDGTADRLDAATLLENADQSLPILVLEHEPREFDALKAAGADMALCGHTHNGQVFPGNLVVPFFNENAWGYKDVNGLKTVVTAGVGYYGPPMRVGTDSEITVINLTFQGE